MYFHFTHEAHLSRILGTGTLLPSESNIGSPYPVADGPTGEGVGPDVVWLLDTPTVDPIETPGDDNLTHGLYEAKRHVRFEVDVKAIRWLDWAPTRTMSRAWRESLLRSAGGAEVAEHWYVFPAPIRARRWISIHDMVADTPIEF